MINGFRKVGPELFTIAQGDSPLKMAINAASISTWTQAKLMSQASDSKPELINENGKKNYFCFFPAGCSFNQIHHYAQMCKHGEFKKYDRGSEEAN